MSELLWRGGLSVSAQQAAVVDHVRENQLTVVSAGAGSGKTHTMVATVIDLLERELADLNQFVLITFTRKAADELRGRLERELARLWQVETNEEARRFWRGQQERLSGAYIGTIHGFCRRILRTFGYEERVAREADITFARSARMQATDEALEAYLQGPDPVLFGEEVELREWQLREKIEAVLEQIRNQGDLPSIIRAQTELQSDDEGKPYRLQLAQLVAEVDERYRAKKREAQCLDPHDLLRLTADLLDSPANEQVRVRLGERFRYLFIDEFQDTDRLQIRLVEALLPYLQGILVVGDPKQSIYGFRAADYLLLGSLAASQGTPIQTLSVSRRPTADLLAVQNTLFASMGRRYPELAEPLEPWAGTIQSQSDVPPLVYCSAGERPSQGDRADTLARLLRTVLRRQIDDSKSGILRPIEARDIAILTRSNYAVGEYERYLQAAGLPVRSDTGGSFFERPEIVATYYLLRLILHYPDDTALALALRTPYLRGVDLQQMEQVVLQYGTRTGQALTDQFESLYPAPAAALQALREQVRAETVPQILARLYDLFQIQVYYRGLGSTQAANNLDRLRELARGLFRSQQALTLWQFTGWLQVALLTGREEAEAFQDFDTANEAGNTIRLLTIHRAKGLEFPIVVIPDVHLPLNLEARRPDTLVDASWGLDVQLPVRGIDTTSARFRAQLARTQADRISEEMRIFYVAVTRAQYAVLLMGNSDMQANAPTSRSYSWKDEVMLARGALAAGGARFV